jgi:hypothetical protein
MNANRSKHFGIVNALAALLALALVVAAPPASRADQTDPVHVLIPADLRYDTYFVTPAANGFKYVTVPGLRAVNPSRNEAQTYAATDFHLLTDDATYYPVARPKLASVDFTTQSIAEPGEEIDITVSFLVPNRVETASLEFIPHWRADDGATINFCCAFQ